MSVPIETTAAMRPPAESPGVPARDPSAPDAAVPPVPASGQATAETHSASPRGGREPRRTVSPNVIISLLGGLLTALLLLQLNSLGNSIDSLRAEMQEGFGEINATLLDHTDRLARLEAAHAVR